MKIRIRFFRSMLLITLLLVTMGLHAQITVKGKITSAGDSEPLPGANVILKGTTIGTVTDIDGNYSIEVPNANSVLIFSFIGFNNSEEAVNGRTTINVNLVPDVVSLDAVVVIGYGTQKKADLTSSIAILEPKELAKMPGGVTEGLQGSVAGVNVSRGTVRIRGVGSLGDTDPLWVVDGLIGGQTPNDDEIETIQILKDAASCAIYGSRGANGVIIVTTKKGQKGEPKVEYHGYAGTKVVWNTLDMMNANDFARFVNEAYYNYNTQMGYSLGDANYATTPSDYLDPDNLLADTDWQSEWFRRGYYQSHNISVSGGGNGITYRTGINYTDNQNTVVKSNSNDLSMFLNSNFEKKRLKIGQSFVMDKYYSEYGGGSYYDLLRSPSNLPVYDETSENGYYITGLASSGNDMINQIGVRDFSDYNREYLNIKGTLFAEYELLQGLKYKINLGVDLYRKYSYDYIDAYDLGKGVNEYADLKEGSERTNRYMMENTLTYTKAVGDHNITILAGATSEESAYRTMTAYGQGFAAESLKTLANTLYDQTVTGYEYDKAMYSLLGRVNYDYKGRYLFTANVRYDGSSQFSASNRWGTFPSASVGWRVSDESFMENIYWVNNLKLRFSYGQIGNANSIGYYDYDSYVTSDGQFYTLGTDQADVSAPIPKVFGNVGVKWETSTMTNLGLDLGLYDDLLNFTVEGYWKKTEDLLTEVIIPSSAGTTDPVVMNAGDLKNSGIEFSAKVQHNFGDFSFRIGGNFSVNNNEVLSLGTEDTPISAGEVSTGDYVTRTAVGSSIGRFYGYKTDGLFKSKEEVNAYTHTDDDGTISLIQSDAEAGDIKFVDLNGDGQLSDDDKTWIGNPLPDLSYGFTLDMNYKNFDFSMMWQGEYGQDIYNNGLNIYGHGTSAVNQLSALNNRFRENDLTITSYDAEGNAVTTITYEKNTDTDIPRAIANDPNGNFSRASDYMVQDGSYLRLKRLTIGYTFPKSLISKINIESARFYIGGKNLLTFTKYEGYDPEVAGLNDDDDYNLNRGIDMQKSWASANLTAREWFLGIQVTF